MEKFSLMARQASSKPADSTANGVVSFGIRHSGFVISSVWVHHFIHHLAPQTALRDSAFAKGEAILQVVLLSREANKAKNNMVALPGQLFYSTQIPVCLWSGGKSNTLDLANDARLFDGEEELCLVA